jgi:hypothetical protein
MTQQQIAEQIERILAKTDTCFGDCDNTKECSHTGHGCYLWKQYAKEIVEALSLPPLCDDILDDMDRDDLEVAYRKLRDSNSIYWKAVMDKNNEILELRRKVEALSTNKDELELEKTRHTYTRIAWDKTTQERDDLKNEVKVLTAIKKGLETSVLELHKQVEALSLQGNATPKKLDKESLSALGFVFEKIGHNDFNLLGVFHDEYGIEINWYNDNTFGFPYGSIGNVMDVKSIQDLVALRNLLTNK